MSIALLLPIAGYRHAARGHAEYMGTYATYWTSSPAGAHSFQLLFTTNVVVPQEPAGRGYGASVRCFKNADITPPTAVITYSTTGFTNQDVIVTLTADKELQSLSGWDGN
jgi:hypothetical protein